MLHKSAWVPGCRSSQPFNFWSSPPWLNLFISGAKSDQIWEIFHEWVYLYPVYFLLSWGGVKGGGGGVLLIIYSVNFNPATYLMLQILQETFN